MPVGVTFPMPAKKAAPKLKVQNTVNEQQTPRYLLSFTKGQIPLGTVVVELFIGETPKACEVFSQNCGGGNAGVEKSRSKQAVYKNCPITRVTKLGVQTGETVPAAKHVSVSELEGEIGRAPHGRGTLSLCRSGSTFDGSQFFICLTDTVEETEHLNRKYVAFGKVIRGLDVVSSLAQELLPAVDADGIVKENCEYYLGDVSAFCEEA